MDYSSPRGAGFRIVKTVAHDDKPARAVIASINYTADVHELWDALTNADRIPHWFLPISGQLEPGGRYQLEGNAGGVITRCDAPNALAITWEFAENISWVSVRLEPQGTETRLTLEHVMLQDEASEEHWREYGPGATGVGWELSFFALSLYLNSSGEPINSEINEAWMASDQGKQFIRACAAAWGAAHITAGEKPEVAREMVARTSAAYAGD